MRKQRDYDDPGRLAHPYCDFKMHSSATLVTEERATSALRDNSFKRNLQIWRQ